MTTLTLLPAGRRLEVADDAPLRDVLFAEGVEFPCGGQGRCKGCKVRVAAGRLSITVPETVAFTRAELNDGWRLACCHRAQGELALELAQWQMTILADDRPIALRQRDGLGIAIDLGTTTIAAQALDLGSGHVLATATALNAQAAYGAGVLTRAQFALAGGGGALERIVRDQIGAMVEALAAASAVARIVLVGNSVMHHLFAGLDLAPLAAHPFLPVHPERRRFKPSELGWSVAPEASVEFLPCIGGLVGSDVLAGIVACGLDAVRGTAALIDLGTNGEVVLAHKGRIVCTSTAAGPAFEGARIAHGMRAAAGAIDAVTVTDDGALACHVVGGGPARGLCGSGLVDAVAAGLDLGLIAPGGRLREPMALSGPVRLMPRDVRELQLAKGAIAAGLRLLCAHAGIDTERIDALHLAGAFGNAIDRKNARRIGLVDVAPERIAPAGNAALYGAKLALFDDGTRFDDLAARIDYVPLNEAPHFQDIFAEEMGFPQTRPL